jgi:protocatechuate 3,4-dioxygenase beta subunit
MVYITKFVAALATASFVSSVVAHPGESHSRTQVRRDIVKRDAIALKAKRGLEACSNTLKARELDQRAVARRAAKADKLRAVRGISTDTPLLSRRNLTTLEDFETHNHNLTSTYTDGMALFSSNGSTSCILTPEVTIGPYNIHGELIRSNITETQAGVPVHLEFQFIDYTTCEGVEDMMLDVWAANATGVYSGVDISGNEAPLTSTYLRGLQATDSDGVASFDTIFPGHYAGRAIHQHVVSHYNYTVLPNNTIVGGDINHIVSSPEILESIRLMLLRVNSSSTSRFAQLLRPLTLTTPILNQLSATTMTCGRLAKLTTPTIPSPILSTSTHLILPKVFSCGFLLASTRPPITLRRQFSLGAGTARLLLFTPILWKVCKLLDFLSGRLVHILFGGICNEARVPCSSFARVST